MNPHLSHSVSPLVLLASLLKNASLIQRMAWREIAMRYKGSLFGIAWSFFNPLLMLAVYTFVFTFIFQARWNIDVGSNNASFVLILFVGLSIHAFFAEILTQAPSIILSHTNYVKKVVFPLEVLTIISLVVAVFHALVSFGILFIALLLTTGSIPWTACLAILTILPLFPLTLGFSWILASLGVYIRDISQFIGVAMTMALFLSPVLYPISALPKNLQIVMYFNPLTLPIEQTRSVIIFGQLPDWHALLIYSLVSLLICWLGFCFFQKTRKGFADVI